MPIRAVTFDAYGTLLRDDELARIPERIVADHGLAVSVDEVFRFWIECYHEATQAAPFRTLREIETAVFSRVLRRFDAPADPTPYVDLFFRLTTAPTLYPESLAVLNALGPLPSAIVSNADHEHVEGWSFTLPVRFVVISEAVRAYKPDRRVFQAALDRLGLAGHEVLHVGDSEVDDVTGARAAGLRVAWINRRGRVRHRDVPAPDFEIADLTALPALLSAREPT
jgi:2-haloalkanoic acid dehalogenase type II